MTLLFSFVLEHILQVKTIKLLSKVQFGFEKGTWNWKIWIQWSLQQKKNRPSSNFVQIKLVRQIWHFSPHRMWKEIKLFGKRELFGFYYETNDSLSRDLPHPSIRRGGMYIALAREVIDQSEKNSRIVREIINQSKIVKKLILKCKVAGEVIDQLKKKHRHRRNVTSHHSFSLLWQF